MYGVYDWNTVDESINSYEQVRYLFFLIIRTPRVYINILCIARPDGKVYKHSTFRQWRRPLQRP
jgi:hypothetical protein